jgi:hypothetical protein
VARHCRLVRATPNALGLFESAATRSRRDYEIAAPHKVAAEREECRSATSWQSAIGVAETSEAIGLSQSLGATRAFLMARVSVWAFRLRARVSNQRIQQWILVGLVFSGLNTDQAIYISALFDAVWLSVRGARRALFSSLRHLRSEQQSRAEDVASRERNAQPLHV